MEDQIETSHVDGRFKELRDRNQLCQNIPRDTRSRFVRSGVRRYFDATESDFKSGPRLQGSGAVP